MLTSKNNNKNIDIQTLHTIVYDIFFLLSGGNFKLFRIAVNKPLAMPKVP